MLVLGRHCMGCRCELCRLLYRRILRTETQHSCAASVTQYCYHLLLDLDGALTGLSKKMIRQLYGEAQFKRWRRSYDERPPPISSFSAACEFILLSA
jgi:bisphosphoglycerate-dependent phosphoglycerate mutase